MPDRPHPESRRQRARALGVNESTLRRRDKGAKPRVKPPPVERCEAPQEHTPIGDVCEYYPNTRCKGTPEARAKMIDEILDDVKRKMTGQPKEKPNE